MYSRAARRGLNGSLPRAARSQSNARTAWLTDLRLRSLGSAPVTPVTLAQRAFHSKSSDRSVADAAPIERKATFEKRQEPSPFDGVRERRAKAGKLIAGVAAASDSDMFKAPAIGKPAAKRWDHHLSPESLSRHPCSLKQAARHLKKPGLISLGGGLPSSAYFPYAELSLRVPTAPHFSEAETIASGQTLTVGKYDTRDPEQPGAEYDLSIALNYTQSTGSAQMMRFVTEHTELVYSPPYADWQCCQTVGSTAALEQTLRMFCDKDRGDSVLTEEYSFSTALETIGPLGVKAVGVPIDAEGLLPEAMDEILTGWDPEARGGRRKPHLLYTVPSGQNPTGATQSAARRRAIYAVAQKHDLYIIEDEPYYFIQMQPYTGPDAPSAPPPASVTEFLGTLIPSLLSMDTDGRVLRMDSFSKVLMPGSRLGWVTASAQVIERFIRHAEVANQGPSGLSQIAVWKLLDEAWGHEGYLQWLMNLSTEYTKRRDWLLDACERHLPRAIVSWTPPVAGMFLWLEIDHSTHPDGPSRPLLEIEEEIFNSCIDKGVLCARGSWFRTEQDTPLKNLFFRATFASASEKDMDEAIQRLGAAIRESFRLS
ncbi:aromatic amino acid aminotransferase [Colletotrichum graminicola]|uniref:aromatic-amino-acid transaminase n=1 Tax=Colletotrichum graminicola (strain M1.001 / M2 / FGSC 10212) TaxID=645133 RepID=E3Q5P0_COLGM|nr:aromatic amino acid aminotransferase [Colletotrichum graminicola M1.001]EFQ26531.1 aromatic amino acid aminotransferase [Colletotrichum graminicola M1.001]WDK14411.1 aromatic amino acid aminotransferase [Colletotrichum graminicola]